MFLHNAKHVIAHIARRKAAVRHGVRVCGRLGLIGTAEIIVKTLSSRDRGKLVRSLSKCISILVWRSRSVRVIISMQQVASKISRREGPTRLIQGRFVTPGTDLRSRTLQSFRN